MSIFLLAVLLVCSAPPAMSCTCDVATTSECACGTNGTVNGTVHVEHESNTNDVTILSKEFHVPEGTIKWARVYWAIWGGNYGHEGWSNATFCNASECWENNLYINDSCTQNETNGWYKGGSGSHIVYWNVTDEVSNGYNNLTVDQSSWTGYGYCREIILVVVIDDMAGYPETNYWINQGYNLPTGTKATWFNGPVNTSANHTLHHYAYGDNDAWILKFNNVDVESYSAGGYRGVEAVEIDSNQIDSDNTQKMEWDPWVNNFHPNLGILVGNNRYFDPDLEVGEMKVDRFNNSCPDQTPTGIVVGNSYDVEVEIKNTGALSTGIGFSVTLYDNGNPVQTNSISTLDSGDSTWTAFNWTPTSPGSHTLKAFADSSRVIPEEGGEDNNNKTLVKVVLTSGDPDLNATGCIDFTPAWQCNKTNVVVTVLNDGTGATGAFNVHVTMRNVTTGTQLWEENRMIFMCAKAEQELIFSATPDLIRHYDYNVTVELDSNDQITNELSENNNDETKYFSAIGVKLTVSHHFGNMSDYNGQLSDYNTATMFRINKIVTNYTTPEKLLESEADVTSGDSAPPYVYGINRSDTQGTSTWYMNRSMNETETCNFNRFIFWYCLINGIQTPAMPSAMDTYMLNDGENMHMDLLKYVNSGNANTHFKPHSVMAYPEPFLHGYNGNVSSTTVVYPSNDPGGEYAALATKIQNKLLAEGVTGVNVKTDVTLNTTEKQNNHLILLGTILQNNITDEINTNHAEVGMPVYFNESNWMVDDQLDDCYPATYDSGGVVEACDNPYNNDMPWVNTWMDASQTVWIASGVDDTNAKAAAEVLVNYTDRLEENRFWAYTIGVPIYNGKNLIAIPLNHSTLDDVFGDNPVTDDIVYRYHNGVGYKFAQYCQGYGWYGEVDGVEPIEPGVGYVYQRVGTDYNLTVLGDKRTGMISTPIYNGKNLIGYVNFTKTNLSTFNTPATDDIVYRYHNGVGYSFAQYYEGYGWYGEVDGVEPIEADVGYVYQREDINYNWTYLFN